MEGSKILWFWHLRSLKNQCFILLLKPFILFLYFFNAFLYFFILLPRFFKVFLILLNTHSIFIDFLKYLSKMLWVLHFWMNNYWFSFVVLMSTIRNIVRVALFNWELLIFLCEYELFWNSFILLLNAFIFFRIYHRKRCEGSTF